MRPLLQRVASAPAGRRSKWLVLAAWLILTVALGPLAGKVGDVEDTGPNTFLPRGAESAEVNTELRKFRADELASAVVVYTGDGARAQADADIGALQEFAAEGRTVAPPVPSEDGAAVMTVVPMDSEGELSDTVDRLREVVSSDPAPGVEVAVGGPAGSFTDEVAVFGSLDATLLIATAAVVAALLLLTYRSPFLWLLPLLSVAFAAVLTQACTYLLARYAEMPVDPQSSGVLMVLVFGVGTDYALLLIARYREELHLHHDRHTAMRIALRRSGPAILASAGTIAVGLACLAFADINSSRSLGLVGAVGVVCGFLAMVTVLPALLVVAGRWVFWPFVPRHGTPSRTKRSVWSSIGAGVAARPRRSWAVSAAIIGVLAVSSAGIGMGLTNSEMFKDKPESVVAQERLAAHYPSGASDPAKIVARSGAVAEVRQAASRVEGVGRVDEDGRTPDGLLTTLSVVLTDAPDSEAAKDTIAALRTAVHAVPDADALVGGTTAETVDTERAAGRDLWIVVPIVLLVVLAVLIALLRALVAPLLLLATVVLSFFAALGASNLLFEHALDFAALDWSMLLMSFVFLVALGIDYNIFLMHRVKEETARLGHVRGVREGLTSTGGVITSAGVVLAATFAVFAGLPLVPMAELGVIVGIGVLLDTFVVRTVLVPALALDLGHRFWWPGRLSRATDRRADRSAGRSSANTPPPHADSVRPPH